LSQRELDLLKSVLDALVERFHVLLYAQSSAFLETLGTMSRATMSPVMAEASCIASS